MNDPYVDDSGTLRNLLGITGPVQLDIVEHEHTYLRLTQLAHDPEPGNYDLDHLRAFNRIIFQDVYDWAGEIRTVDIAKTDLFCLARLIETASTDVFSRVPTVRADLEDSNGLIPTSMADLYAEINALHPFRDGNGRAQRAFLQQLARDHNVNLNWNLLDPVAHVDASSAAHRGDLTGLHVALRVAAHQPVPDGGHDWARRLTANRPEPNAHDRAAGERRQRSPYRER